MLRATLLIAACALSVSSSFLQARNNSPRPGKHKHHSSPKIEAHKHHSSPKIEAHSWKNHDSNLGNHTPVVALALAGAEDISADVYFLRHGETDVNLFPPRGVEMAYNDASINAKGVQQAVAAREIFKELGLDKVPVCDVQLASSLHSRATDTAIIATTGIWRDNHASDNPCFRLQELPALMEMDSVQSKYSSRKVGVHEDDPVRWKDSVLSSKLGALADASAAKTLFYKKDEELETTETQKPVEVRTSYERHRPSVLGCMEKQNEQVRRYLVDTMHAGKKHIILGTSGIMTMCASHFLGIDHDVPTNAKITFNPTATALPNASVLHLKAHLLADGSLKVESRKVYINSQVIRDYQASQAYNQAYKH